MSDLESEGPLGQQPAAPTRARENETGRLEAFSDGVLAVIITIMALELRGPLGSSFGDLRRTLPSVLIYALSFTFVGIYWNNHHHLLRAATKISGAVMWSNLLLLFCLSLIPAATEWVGRQYGHAAPAAVYGAVALAGALAFNALTYCIIRTEGPSSRVARAVGRDPKGRISAVLYVGAIGCAFLTPYVSYAVLVAVALIWFVPDRRLEAVMADESGAAHPSNG